MAELARDDLLANPTNDLLKRYIVNNAVCSGFFSVWVSTFEQNAEMRNMLIDAFGDKTVLILRNHGLIAVGANVTDAFQTYWTLQRACEIQLAGDSMPGAAIPIPRAVLEAIPAQVEIFRSGPRPGGLAYDALLRRAGIHYEDLI